jgi:regulator of protease activity HflC (stomatin/prohibitin superfamily)
MLCTSEQIAITKDNAQITIQIIIFYRIIDAFKLEFKLGR